LGSGEPKDLGLDGLFKLLTWRSLAISRVFGLPDIVGEPLQQEFQFPRERRVDRLYRLADGSLLNIEHQSSLADREALARRMVTYHVMIKDQFPAAGLMQIVIYTGRTPIRPEGPLIYESLDASGAHGLRFTAALRDFRSLPVDEFRKSGRADDLVLGLMAAGGDDPTYAREVRDFVLRTRGAQRIDLLEKMAAVYATMPERAGWSAIFGEVEMFPAEIEDTPLHRRIVEFFGRKMLDEAADEGRREGLGEGRREGLSEGRRLALAELIIRHARRNGVLLTLPEEEAAARLAGRASEDALMDMASVLPEMKDADTFFKRFGVDLSNSAGETN
jgi:hypothetical protein